MHAGSPACSTFNVQSSPGSFPKPNLAKHTQTKQIYLRVWASPCPTLRTLIANSATPTRRVAATVSPLFTPVRPEDPASSRFHAPTRTLDIALRTDVMRPSDPPPEA